MGDNRFELIIHSDSFRIESSNYPDFCALIRILLARLGIIDERFGMTGELEEDAEGAEE
jgi:hypothetical protein